MIIGLTGKPQVGKTTYASYLQHYLQEEFHIKVVREKFARPLGGMAQALLGMNDEDFKRIREEKKDDPLRMFYGYTLRQLLITISEEWMKPKFGSDVFGKLMGQRLGPKAHIDPTTVTIIDDCGFADEVNVLQQYYRSRFLLIKIERKNTTYIPDSREDLVSSAVLHNDGTEAALAQSAKRLAKDIFDAKLNFVTQPNQPFIFNV